MWPFRSIKTLKESGIFTGFTDWHSHILPGVDDGLQALEDSIRVLQIYDELGVKKVWLTPHIMEDMPNHPQDLYKRFEELKSVWSGKAELQLAAENMLDNLFEERLENDELLPICEDGKHLLVETSYYTPPMGLNDMFDRIKSKGYYPILAHPERYRYMEIEDYKDLKNNDIFFQMNLASLVGGYGESARKKAEWLLENDMINFVGTDLHRLSAAMSWFNSSPKKEKYLKRIMSIVETTNS